MNKTHMMTKTTHQSITAEQLAAERLRPENLEAEANVRYYNAVDAAAQLRLPIHILSESESRRRHQIPHYQINRFIRYRLDELEAWMKRRSDAEHGTEVSRGA